MITTGVFPEGHAWVVRCSECGVVDSVSPYRGTEDPHAAAIVIARAHEVGHLAVTA